MGTVSPVTPVGLPDPTTTHRTKTNTRTSLEPIGYYGEGAPLYAWQLDDER